MTEVQEKSLADIARVLRSKNAGPFELTIDAIFNTIDDFNAVRNSGVLRREEIARIYRIKPEAIIVCDWFESLLAFKATLPRPHIQGGFGEIDMHACQQYLPLAGLIVKGA